MTVRYGDETRPNRDGGQSQRDAAARRCSTLLLVDDMRVNRAVLRALLENEYEIIEAENGVQALAWLRRDHARIAAVLLDLLMPVKDGYAVLQEAAADAALSRIPIIVITSDHTPESEIRALDLGATDIITKPFESRSIRRRIRNAVELYLEELVREQAARIRESNAALIDGLSAIIEHRSLESGQHIRRIRGFTRILLEEVAREHPEYELDGKTISLISSASSLHDIGKIAIPDAVLNKPGRLTPEEFEIMKTHTLRGCDMLTGLGQIREPEYMGYAYNICRYHHERWDGRGYPDGLRGANIPIYAQVVSVADCFDALTTDRVYKKAIPLQEACDMIRRGECGTFSEELMTCFEQVQPAFFELARRYADGMHAAESGAPAPTRTGTGTGLPARSRDKLTALLRHQSATVLEVDRNAEIARLLYLADRNFSALRRNQTPEEAERVFLSECVHPEDRERIKTLLDTLGGDFFREGAQERSECCRVRDLGSDGYAPYRCAVLRLGGEDNPRSLRALVVWDRLADGTDGAAERTALPESRAAELDRLGGREMTLLSVNRAFCELTGYSRQALHEKFQNSLAALLDPADRDRTAAQLKRQMAAGRDARLEYRLKTADGRTIWVLERGTLEKGGDGEYFRCTLTDITAQKETQESLRRELERYRAVIRQEDAVLFEWDAESDRLWLSGDWELRFGYPPENALRPELESKTHIYPPDVENIRRAMRDIQNGSMQEEVEFRALTAGGQYRWQRARMTVQLGGEGRPCRVVGLLLDGDRERWGRSMTDRSQRDRLTGLYRGEAAQREIARCLSRMDEDAVPAVLLLNVDGFSRLNRRYGSLFGDAVLEELARALRRTFREADVIARMGGDEFLVFLPGVSSAESAGVRAGQLLESCRRVMRSAGELSCRVGVALDWRHTRDCNALLRDCMRALARAKSRGGDGYVIFSEETAGPEEPLSLPPSPQIEPGEDLQRALSAIIGDTLRAARETAPAEAMMRALERMGRLLSASRVYIFEAMDGGSCRESLAWRAAGVPPLAEGWPGADDRRVSEAFDDRGILTFQDTDALEPEQRLWMQRGGTLSSLWCAVADGERFLGFVGFDDCALRRVWRQEQKEALAFAAKLLFSILNGGAREPGDPSGGPRA